MDEFETTGPDDWIATVNTGLDQLKQSCTSIFVIGISMGGTLALHLGATRGGDLAGVGVINAPVGDLPEFEAAANNPQVPARFPAPWATDARMISKDLATVGITYGEIPKVCLQKAVVFFKDTEGVLGQLRLPTMLFYSRDDAVVPPITGQRVLERLSVSPDRQLIELLESAHEATLDFDLERIGLEWLRFVRKHSLVLTPA